MYYGIFLNASDGYTYGVSDVLCADEDGVKMVFEDETLAELYLLENIEYFKAEYSNDEHDFYISKVKLKLYEVK